MNPFKQLDRVLRGEGTRADALRGGRLDLSARAMLVAVVVLGAFYGACMGCYNLVAGEGGAWRQVPSSMVKVPALFLLTLAVTFPSLYVFNALVGSRLGMADMLRLILAAIGVMLAVLAGFGTIVAFFNFTTESYPFILILNVVVFAVAGVLGLSFLLQTLRRLTEPADDGRVAVPVAADEPGEESAPTDAPADEVEGGGPSVFEVPESVASSSTSPPRKPFEPIGLGSPSRRPGALTRVQAGPTAAGVKTIFRIWVVVFALVGAQMSWVLRPFIGSYATGGFVWFRPRGGNFFESVWHTLTVLLGGR